MNIRIAVAESYKYKVSNKVFTYDDFSKFILGFEDINIQFINKDNQPFQTAFEECIKNQKEKILGYVGGVFNGNDIQRIEENISCRTLIVLDIDKYSGNITSLEQHLHKELSIYKYLAHSTIGHTPDKPRVRIILFPNRDIKIEEFKTVVNNFTESIGFTEENGLDESSTKPNQFMLVAVTPKVSNLPNDKEYKYIPWQLENEKGELIKVDDYVQDKVLIIKDAPLNEDIINCYENLPSGLTIKEIKKYLDFCKPKSANYDDHIMVGMALHHELRGSDEGKELWKEWAKKYKKSDENIKNIDYKWSTFDINNDADKNVKMKTIIAKYNSFHKKLESNCPELQELLNQIKTDAIQHNKETGEQKLVPLDIFKYAKRIKEIRTRLVKENIGSDKKKNPNFTILNNIYSDIREYNNLLSLDEAEDKPYTCEQFFKELAKNTNHGLKTGFKDLDEHITIQPSSLAFIAGRPSHGKTTMMLNILRNMLEDKNNEDKAFLFYSYEETRSDILIKIILSVADDGLDQELMNAKVEGTNLRQRALNNFKSHPLCVIENLDADISTFNYVLGKAHNKVDTWIKEGRLEILTPKSTAESLSTAIVERCMDFKEEEQAKEGGVKKKVAAVFIDYVQKLTTEEERVNRQQEIQKICQTLLSTALDTRAGTSIILGAQVNRNVTSFDTLTLDNMRESGDIEQDANLVLGIWNKQAGEIDKLLAKEAELENKLQEADFNSKSSDNEDTQKKLNLVRSKLNENRETSLKTIKVKVLKNRNGQNNGTFELDGHLDRYFIDDTFETKDKYKSLSDLADIE